ncbi:hypothetical protein CDAR_125471 [Caerostris darwini]|uniref:Secreted protein n=1 Tax=Caerostris darwini TaxID=1538125 RepID=A0AAV4X1C4_9ARAC|nr:hypothetical protein CDAR_125471 [Caerostris darwini]
MRYPRWASRQCYCFLSPCVYLDVSLRLGLTVAWIISSVGTATGKGAPSHVLFPWQLEIIPWAIFFDELPISLAFNMETRGRTFDDFCVL